MADVPCVIWARVAGTCYRAVSAVHEETALAGSMRPARFNRPGQSTLYMSGSVTGVTAAMARYGGADRTLMSLTVDAGRLIDLRDRATCVACGMDPGDAEADWIAALEQGAEPPSWRISDRARSIGADGLIDASRRAPGAWHLVLFQWNVPGGPQVLVAA